MIQGVCHFLGSNNIVHRGFPINKTHLLSIDKLGKKMFNYVGKDFGDDLIGNITHRYGMKSVTLHGLSGLGIRVT